MLQAANDARETTVALARRRERERDAEHVVLDGEPAEVERRKAPRSSSLAEKAKVSSPLSQSGGQFHQHFTSSFCSCRFTLILLVHGIVQRWPNLIRYLRRRIFLK